MRVADDPGRPRLYVAAHPSGYGGGRRAYVVSTEGWRRDLRPFRNNPACVVCRSGWRPARRRPLDHGAMTFSLGRDPAREAPRLACAGQGRETKATPGLPGPGRRQRTTRRSKAPRDVRQVAPCIRGSAVVEIDPGGWLIRGLERAGLVWNVRRISAERQAERLERRRLGRRRTEGVAGRHDPSGAGLGRGQGMSPRRPSWRPSPKSSSSVRPACRRRTSSTWRAEPATPRCSPPRGRPGRRRRRRAAAARRRGAGARRAGPRARVGARATCSRCRWPTLADAVLSVFGVIFARDPVAALRELARSAARPAGRSSPRGSRPGRSTPCSPPRDA